MDYLDSLWEGSAEARIHRSNWMPKSQQDTLFWMSPTKAWLPLNIRVGDLLVNASVTKMSAESAIPCACTHTDGRTDGSVVIPQDHWQANAQVCQYCQNHSSLIQQLPAKITELYLSKLSRIS
jgi:hypothetical protein